jgi:hypothetical protein
VIDTVTSSQQLLGLLDQCASAVYASDPELSIAMRDRTVHLGELFGDLACIECASATSLPANPSFRQVANLVFGAFPKMKHELRILVTRADQTLGRQRFRQVLRECA